MTVMPEFDGALCDGCGLCVAACHGKALVQEGDKVRLLESERCDYCGVCEAVCPHQAIECPFTVTCSENPAS